MSGRPIALLNSKLTHGARIVSASPDRFVNGIAVARLGDPVSCPLHPQPPHGLNRISIVDATQQSNTRKTAHVGDKAACGAIIITGSSNVFIG